MTGTVGPWCPRCGCSSSRLPSPALNLRAPSSDKSGVPQSALASALRDLSVSNRALRRCLEENEKIIRRALEMTDEGVSVPAMLDELPVYEGQKPSDEAMMALYEARDRIRKVTICEGLEAGLTVEQLAAMFHLSPDLISSYVAERSNWFSPALSQQGRADGSKGVPPDDALIPLWETSSAVPSTGSTQRLPSRSVDSVEPRERLRRWRLQQPESESTAKADSAGDAPTRAGPAQAPHSRRR